MLKSMIAALLLLTPRPLTPPDEGQWLPLQFRAMDWSALRERGLALTKNEFWHPEKGGVLSAAVQINGCSASFVSEDGLLVTNHHCGFGAINRLSTVENNFLRDGFIAKDRASELPARGMTIFIVARLEDVTERVLKAREAAGDDPRARFVAERTEMVRIEREAERAEPDLDVRVVSYFEGREYQAIYRRQVKDVRLVYAPPQSIGEFGGETDNWMWPRHTGDFTFFRAYMAPDGELAPYSEENVPFRPEHFLKVAPQGVSSGDLVMILGYPGSTERYRSSRAVEERQRSYYPMRYELYTRLIEIWKAEAAKSEQRALGLASTIKSAANVQKNALGMFKGLARNGVVARKLKEEAEFAAWVQAEPQRQEAYGDVLARLLELDDEEAKWLCHDLLLGNMRGRLPLLRGLMDASAAARRGREPRGLDDAGLDANFESIQRPMLEVFVDLALRLEEGHRFASLDAIRGEETDAEAIVEKILSKTAMLRPAAREALEEKGAEGFLESEDPLLMLANDLARDLDETRTRLRRIAGERLEIGSTWIRAQQEWRGRDFYPDANSTLRVSVASVKGYEPRDGVWHDPHTTLAGVLAKETGEEPFASPAPLLEAARAEDKGRFVHPDLGDVPVCFLSDGDTTGGNSGSPVINGRGELVGLNFDRVFENVAGDYGWNPQRSRNISVDIRYVLWVLDRAFPAPHLLKEMGF